MKERVRRAVAVGMAVIISSTAAAEVLPVASANNELQDSLIQSFTEPDGSSGLMARFWFPDAGAGYDSDGDGIGDYIDLVKEQISELADSGFGGVEITMLADNSNFFWEGGNELASQVGWGTKAWAEVIAAAVDKANNKDNPFRVDVTITAHWPMIINNVDPNDDRQQQELAVADYQKITKEIAENGTDLTLPEIAVKDASNTARAISSYIRTDKLVSAVIAQVDTIDESGNPVLDYDTLQDLTSDTSQREGYAAGIPMSTDQNNDKYTLMKLENDGSGNYQWKYYTNEDAYAEYGVISAAEYIPIDSDGKFLEDAVVNVAYSTFGAMVSVVDKSGNKIDGASYIAENELVVKEERNGAIYYSKDVSQVEGVDALIRIYNTDYFGDREVMKDTQLIYSLDGADIETVTGMITDEDTEIAAGDYVLVNTYRRGTAQISSGGENITMENKTYCVDYFSTTGAQAVIDYWDENLLPHTYVCEDGQTRTLKELMSSNGGYIFEDSIELSHEGLLWSEGLIREFEAHQGYNIGTYAAVLAGEAMLNEKEAAARVEQDYKKELSSLYSQQHLETVSNWTGEFNYKFRAQCHGIDAVDADEAALTADIAESDNATDGFGTRVYAGAVNVDPDKKVMSNEALTFGTGFSEFPSWYYCINTINRYFSEGINRIILHGTPFKKTYTDYDKQWPGWDFMSFMAWNARQTWWEDVDIFTDYVGRVQGILENGQSKIPVAVLVDPEISNISKINGGVSLSKRIMQRMIGEGYNYNIITKSLMESDLMTTTSNSLSGNTVLSPYAEYQVLILSDISCMSIAAMEKIVAAAEAGLLVIDVDSDINKVYGTDKGTDDTEIQDLYSRLQNAGGYIRAQGSDADEMEEDMLSLIKERVNSGVNYLDERADASEHHIWLENTRLYDETDGSNYYMFYNESGVSVGAEQDASFGPEYWGENGPISTTAELEGTGVPYNLDPTDGTVTAIADYQKTGKGVKVDIDIDEGDLFFIVVSASEEIAALAKAQVSKTDTDTIELGAENIWNLDLESWSADLSEANTDTDGTMYDPSQSVRTLISNISAKLGIWKELQLSTEQLEMAGVSAAGEISGIGYYTAEVEIPDYGDEVNIGAIVQYAFNQQYNCLTNVTVENASGEITEIHANNPNHLYLDIGTALSPGTNKITLKLCGDLTARANGANVENGLTDVKFKLYTTAKDELQLAVNAANKAKEEAEKAKVEAEMAAENAAQAEAEARKAEEEAKKAETAASEAQKKSEAEKTAAEKAKQEAQTALTAATKQLQEAKKAEQQAKQAQEKAEQAAKEAQETLKKLQSQSIGTTVTVKKATIKKVTSSKKKQAKVVWNKLSGVSGYQVQYSTSKKFKNAKTKLVSKSGATGVTLKKLKSGKKYYVRVRAYKNVNGKKVYGKYSSKKQVTIKK